MLAQVKESAAKAGTPRGEDKAVRQKAFPAPRGGAGPRGRKSAGVGVVRRYPPIFPSQYFELLSDGQFAMNTNPTSGTDCQAVTSFWVTGC